MAHYAFLDKNNRVVEVVPGKEPDEDGVSDWEQFYGNVRGQVCKRTSYNTHAGEHRLGGEPFRKNYAGVGYTYDAQRDAFIPPKPFDSWVLNEQTCLWEAPNPYPLDGKPYYWNESVLSWIEVFE